MHTIVLLSQHNKMLTESDWNIRMLWTIQGIEDTIPTGTIYLIETNNVKRKHLEYN